MRTSDKIVEILKDLEKVKNIAIRVGAKYYAFEGQLETMQENGYFSSKGEFFSGEEAEEKIEKVKIQMEVVEEILGEYLAEKESPAEQD